METKTYTTKEKVIKVVYKRKVYSVHIFKGDTGNIGDCYIKDSQGRIYNSYIGGACTFEHFVTIMEVIKKVDRRLIPMMKKFCLEEIERRNEYSKNHFKDKYEDYINAEAGIEKTEKLVKDFNKYLREYR